MAKTSPIDALMKTPPNKLRRAPEEEAPAEELPEEEGYDAGAVSAVQEFFALGKKGDYAGAYEAFKNLKQICEAEEEV